MENPQEYIDILISLEPVFRQAGELALKMRQTAASKSKYDTGVAGIDIVTEADIAVQEFILSEIIKTKLVDCQLVGEEDTPSVSKFKGTNGLVLTLDPIDGTLIYASAGRFYSTIISLNNKKDILYTFVNYPEVNFARRITANGSEDFGKLPEISMKTGEDLSKTIFYTVRGPKKIDPEIYKQIIGQGYSFKIISEITDEAGSCTILFSGKTGGYYIETPNPYDGMVAFHYSQAKKLKIYGSVDISKFDAGDHGPHYSGWYVVLNK